MNQKPDQAKDSRPVVTHDDIVDGLQALQMSGVEIVVVHSSLSAFGWVAGGARTVVAAVRSVVPTVIAPAFTHAALLPSPPEPYIPFNADTPAATWEEFREALSKTPVHRTDGPIDRKHGRHRGRVRRRVRRVPQPRADMRILGCGPPAHPKS